MNAFTEALPLFSALEMQTVETTFCPLEQLALDLPAPAPRRPVTLEIDPTCLDNLLTDRWVTDETLQDFAGRFWTTTRTGQQGELFDPRHLEDQDRFE